MTARRVLQGLTNFIGNFKEAIQEMEKFVQLAPNDPRGPERLNMLKARLDQEKQPESSQTTPTPD